MRPAIYNTHKHTYIQTETVKTISISERVQRPHTLLETKKKRKGHSTKRVPFVVVYGF